MKYYYLLLTILLFGGCDKDTTITPINCGSLQQGLVNSDVTLINKALASLINVPYTQEHLEELASNISKNCDIETTLLCFDCINTLPQQSEIRFTFLDNHGDSVMKVLDLTHSPDDKIKLLAVHE